MRTDNWKMLARLKNDTSYLPLIHNLYDGNESLVKEADLVDFELYNMNVEIEEAENVAEKHPEKFMPPIGKNEAEMKGFAMERNDYYKSRAFERYAETLLRMQEVIR